MYEGQPPAGRTVVLPRTVVPVYPHRTYYAPRPLVLPYQPAIVPGTINSPPKNRRK